MNEATSTLTRAATKAQRALQPQSTDSLRLIGEISSGGQPYFKRRSRLIKNGTACHAGLMLTALAHQAISAGLQWRTDDATLGTNEFFGPAQPLKIVKTGLLSMKPIHELAPCLWVIVARNG